MTVIPDWRDRAAYNRTKNAERRARCKAERRCPKCGDRHEPGWTKIDCAFCAEAKNSHKERAPAGETLSSGASGARHSPKP